MGKFYGPRKNMIDENESESIAWKDTNFQILDRLAGQVQPWETFKRWGKEETYFNNEYCLKVITINPSESTSMHFHIEKHESLLVIKGKLTLKYNDGKGGVGEDILEPGDAFIIPPGFQHRLCAGSTGVVIVEASTYDNRKDSIRVSL
jgi:mannose-6-phosphate isomerase-like protein (cupin superfamily)